MTTGTCICRSTFQEFYLNGQSHCYSKIIKYVTRWECKNEGSSFFKQGEEVHLFTDM
ncbi:hypothetical protein RKD55_002267 [Rossellomorea marisflavi]